MMEKLLLTKIPYDAQITVSKGFLKYKNVNKKIYAIANGVDTADFSKVRVRKNSDPTLIWVGRLHPDKGVEYLKQAVVKARRKIPNLRTELVTGGRLYGAGLIRAYKKAHVFVLPSLAEGQPITLLEAWAAKLPVVVTEVGENPQMVKNGVNGFLVEPANVNQLAKYILKALRGKKLSKSMGIAGYKLVEKEYTWEKVADETYKVYKGLLE
jgi:glycosyltransferase involved in cell wall biosynthesis